MKKKTLWLLLLSVVLSGIAYGAVTKTIEVLDSRYVFPLGIDLATGTTTSSPIKFGDGDLLTTPEKGSIEFADDKFYITNINTQRAIDRTSDVLLETVTVSNTTDETTVYTAIVPVNSAKVGNVLKAEVYGLISTVLPGDVCTIRVKIGNVTVVSLDNPGKTLTDECWEIKAIGTIRAVGVSGQVALKVEMSIEDAIEDYCQLNNIDTTTVENLTITAQWNNAKAGNSITVGQGYMEYKN